MRNKPALALVTVSLVAVAGLASCSRPGASANEGGSDVIRLATGVDPSYTPVYVAVDQGYFEDEGLEVDYFTTEGGPTMTQAVIAGEADVATQSDSTTVSLMPTAPQLRALVNFEQSDSYIKVVLGPGVDSVADVKKVAAVPGLMSYATTRYLESEGIDPSTVEFVETPPPDVPVVLKRGDVDATVVYEPWASRAADEAGGTIVGTIGDFGVSYEQWLITTDGWLADNEDAAAKLAAALAKADEFVRDNPEEAAAITEKMIKTPADQVLQILEDLEFEVNDIDADDVDRMQDAADYFVEAGSIEKAPDLETQLMVDWYSSTQ